VLGREVGIVPAHPSEPNAGGSNALLRNGAHPILDVRDALALLRQTALRNRRLRGRLRHPVRRMTDLLVTAHDSTVLDGAQRRRSATPTRRPELGRTRLR
jgi:predicted Rossmann fold nucleotide-binding protein DprA/Smf involved in DNA uptake